jgi:hypothetical protein
VDRLLSQAFVTLNVLQGYRMNPRLVAQARAQLSGTFELYRTPITPPKSACGICATQAVDGWYLGSIAEHYRYYKVWI